MVQKCLLGRLTLPLFLISWNAATTVWPRRSSFPGKGRREEGKKEDVAGQYEAVRADTGIFRRREGKVCDEIRIQ